MKHAALADAAALAHCDARVEDALLTDFSVLPDVDVRINDGTRSDLRVLVDDGKGKNRGALFHLGGLRHESLRTDARGNLQRRREKLQKLREGGTRLLHMDGRQRKVLHILGQEDGGRRRRLGLLDMGRGGKGDLRPARRLDVRRARDDDAFIACKPAFQEAGDFPQRLFHRHVLSQSH